jgi:hypothetical protein
VKNVSKPEIKLSPKKIFIAILKGLVVALVLIKIIGAIIWAFIL